METHHSDDEFDRINDLNSYKVLDTPHEVSFNQLATLASIICQTPIALISFIDQNRQWYKASIGINLHEVPKYLTACNETITRRDSYVFNASTTESTYSSYMKEHGFDFYAGVPIVSSNGQNIGTLCVVDYVSRSISEEQIDTLKIISGQISSLLELRKNYQENLNRLKELGHKKANNSQSMQSILFREKLRSYAEFAAGLSFRLKTQVLVIENVKKELSRNTLKGTSELDLLSMSVENIYRLIDSLDGYILAEKEQSMKPFEINEAVQGVLDSLEHRIKKNNISLFFDSEESFITVGNVYQFSEVICAVVMNAIEAVENVKERIINIKVYRNNHDANIDIMDSGNGIKEEILPYIFQPFFTTKGPNSLGIGLSLGETLMHRHSGDIQIVRRSSPTIFRLSFQVP